MDVEFRFRPCAWIGVRLRTWRTGPPGGGAGTRTGGFQFGCRDRAACLRRRRAAGVDMVGTRARRAADPAHYFTNGGHDRRLLVSRTRFRRLKCCCLASVRAAASRDREAYKPRHSKAWVKADFALRAEI